jgi:acyl-coenzyme A synthetase/AMP-(fatty) acid ligase
VPILAVPRHEDGYGDFEAFTAREINDLADRAAMLLIRQGLAQLSEGKSVTIALLGQGSAQYVATYLALAKLGYTVFLLSPRLSASTIAALLAKTDCRLVMFTENTKAKIEEVQALRELKTVPMATRPELTFDGAAFQASNYETASWSHSSKIGFIWHSSGSTGIPKIFPVTQQTLMARLRSAVKFGKPGFITSSVYNAAGTTFTLVALSNSEITYYYNDFLPYTAEGITTLMVEAKPHILIILPCVLGQLATSSTGLQALKNCSSVNSFGATCPTELGNRLVEEGVKLSSGYAM